MASRPVSSRDRERFLVQVYRTTGGDTEVIVQEQQALDKLINQCGLTADQARQVVDYLLDKKLLGGKVFVSGGKLMGGVRITIRGAEEAARLEQPLWKRWLSDRAVLAAILTGAITVLGMCLLEVLKRWVF